MRLFERLNSRSITVSVVDNLRQGSNGLFDEDMGRVEIGPMSLLFMLKGKRHGTALHEFTHQMFSTRRAVGRKSIFDHRSQKNASDRTGAHLLEEVYAHIAGAAREARQLRRPLAPPLDVVMLERVRAQVWKAAVFAFDALKHLESVQAHLRRSGSSAADSVSEPGRRHVTNTSHFAQEIFTQLLTLKVMIQKADAHPTSAQFRDIRRKINRIRMMTRRKQLFHDRFFAMMLDGVRLVRGSAGSSRRRRAPCAGATKSAAKIHDVVAVVGVDGRCSCGSRGPMGSPWVLFHPPRGLGRRHGGACAKFF